MTRIGLGGAAVSRPYVNKYSHNLARSDAPPLPGEQLGAAMHPPTGDAPVTLQVYPEHRRLQQPPRPARFDGFLFQISPYVEQAVRVGGYEHPSVCSGGSESNKGRFERNVRVGTGVPRS